MHNSISLPILLLIWFEGANSFVTRRAVKWLLMILPAYICCVEAQKNNHPLLAGDTILATSLICMKLWQCKSATGSISLAAAIWGDDTRVVGECFLWLVRSGRGWCCQHWHGHHHCSIPSLCFRHHYLGNHGRIWCDRSCWPCRVMLHSGSPALPFPYLWHSDTCCIASFHLFVKSSSLYLLLASHTGGRHVTPVVAPA